MADVFDQLMHMVNQSSEMHIENKDEVKQFIANRPKACLDDVLIKKWNYFLHNFNYRDQEVLSILLQNCLDFYPCKSEYSLESMLNLTRDVWLNLELRRVMAVSPIWGVPYDIFSVFDQGKLVLVPILTEFIVSDIPFEDIENPIFVKKIVNFVDTYIFDKLNLLLLSENTGEPYDFLVTKSDSIILSLKEDISHASGEMYVGSFSERTGLPIFVPSLLVNNYQGKVAMRCNWIG